MRIARDEPLEPYDIHQFEAACVGELWLPGAKEAVVLTEEIIRALRPLLLRLLLDERNRCGQELICHGHRDAAKIIYAMGDPI